MTLKKCSKRFSMGSSSLEHQTEGHLKSRKFNTEIIDSGPLKLTLSVGKNYIQKI
jgi:hypothetical protein